MIWLGTSWKMTKTLPEATTYVDELLASSLPPGVQPFVLPAHTALAGVSKRLPADCGILLGAQNAHWGPEGACTGEVSMRMVRDAGARLVEIGHSERRRHFGETDRTVALKTAAAVAAGLTPLVCVGEPASVREAGDELRYVEEQVRAALSELAGEAVAEVIIAYEPVWAIGEEATAATPDQVAPVLEHIAAVVASHSSGGPARALLYGGSVDQTNAVTLLTQTHSDGLFVGRAAWSAAGFLELLHRCASVAPVRQEGPSDACQAARQPQICDLGGARRGPPRGDDPQHQVPDP